MPDSGGRVQALIAELDTLSTAEAEALINEVLAKEGDTS